MKTSKSLRVAAALAASFAVAGVANGQQTITGSAHDFSVAEHSVWNASGQICLPCHTPHFADTTVSTAPLWNHALSASTQSYDLYGGGSATRDNALDDFSILCVSCHDGTIALDAFGGAAGNPANTMTLLHPEAAIGTDLSNDHPIGVTALYNGDGTNFKAVPDSPLQLVSQDFGGGADTYVSCVSCHEPHNNVGAGNNFMLRLSDSGSLICLGCHIK